ncbi:hypothetical protein SBA5_980006 [Candidatus Sulfotelmatomonas gaucii]|uniref:Uncharacterized protein n=1 Tax=Candidatus Sulfuritelmatomonas gaucii TaxID=2043161 RepID=A0A2N9MAE9_9BACT|nr:hypothetical protein SBA5_980006 [Candidatus Sulfotelmatomonas gaucii]
MLRRLETLIGEEYRRQWQVGSQFLTQPGGEDAGVTLNARDFALLKDRRQPRGNGLPSHAALFGRTRRDKWKFIVIGLPVHRLFLS